MRLKPLYFNVTRTCLFVCAVLMLILISCSSETGTPIPVAAPTLISNTPTLVDTPALVSDTSTQKPVVTTTDQSIQLGINVDSSIDVASLKESSGDTLQFDYHINCYCINKQIKAILSLKPQNGTPPYIIPGFEFVESQSFSGYLGDIYSITIKSSDEPPLTWQSDITLECNPIPACPTPVAGINGDNNDDGDNGSLIIIHPTTNSPSTLVPGGGDDDGGTGDTSTGTGGTGTGGTGTGDTSTGTGGTSSGGTSGQCQTKNCDKMIDECPPPGQGGGEPPGICKKK